MGKWLSNREFVSGGILLVFSVWFYLTAQAIPDGSVTGMPPGFFPSFLAVCLGVCSVFLFGKGLKDVLKGKTSVDQTKDQKTVLIIVGLLIIYVLLLNIIGFIPTTILYLLSLMLLLKAGKPLKLILISVVITLGVYFVFGNLFNIPLP